METIINELENIFRQMVQNYNTFGECWKNISLGKRAFELMKELPDVVPGEIDSDDDRCNLLGQMLEHLNETDSPRFCISVREYIKGLCPNDEENLASLNKLYEFIDMNIPMEEWCRKHNRFLKFDPVERTQEWESIFSKVEQECSEQLKDIPKGMGFCFAYWSTKKSVLHKYGIYWETPGEMNPGVMFD